jgi:hypothetical protein
MISTGKNKLLLIGVIIALVIALFGHRALAFVPGDSTERPLFTISPRLHSSGYFPFTGALLNNNPVADVNIFYERKRFGFFVFQSVDLGDRHSYANYLQPGVFASMKVKPNLRIRAFFGYIFSQTQSFNDPESDYYAAVMVNWQVSRRFRVENTLLFYDFSISKKLADRVLLEYSTGKLRVSAYLWQRTVIDEEFGCTSGALAFTFPIIKLSTTASVELTTTYMGYLSQNKPDFAQQQGAFVTLAVPLNLGKK